jgi:hypothetical protein
MKGTRCDTWTRRRIALAASGAVAAAAIPPELRRAVRAHDALPGCKKKSGKKRKRRLKRAKAHNAQHTRPQVFEFTAASQFYTAPAPGTLTVDAFGAQGGNGGDGQPGGEFSELAPGAGGSGGSGAR